MVHVLLIVARLKVKHGTIEWAIEERIPSGL